MSTKKVGFGASRPSAKTAAKKMDAWVSGQGTASSSAAKSTGEEKMKRLSLDLTVTMHKDLMTYCITHETKASDLLRELIARKIYRN